MFSISALLFSCVHADAAIAPLLAGSQPSGSVTVRLCPTEGTVVGLPTVVTFGFPFPAGSVTPAALNTVRVLYYGVEVRTSVEMLTPWRHATDLAKDGKHVRVARIQFYFAPSVAFPKFEEITVEWGKTARTQTLPFQEPRNGWRLVTTGGFTSADQIYEPSVYAVLPQAVLAKGALTSTQVSTTSAAITEPRADPSVPKPATWTPSQKIQAGMRDFFYTIVNKDDPKVSPVNLCPFKTGYEPWLFDRAASMYDLYFQTGWITPLREAVRNAQFYVKQLHPESSPIAGIFKLKQPSGTTSNANDVMYSYMESLAYTFWLTGDEAMRTPMQNVVNAHNKWAGNTRWSPTMSFWTERSSGFKLLANTVAFEVFGLPVHRANLLAIAQDFIWLQDGAGGAIPSSKIDGGLWHYGRQHGEGTATAFVASPWMSIIADYAMVRTYAVTTDAKIAGFVRRMGGLFKVASRSDTGHQYGGGALTYPDYLTRIDGVAEMRSEGDGEHAFEVATGAAWAAYFAELLNQPDASLDTLTTALESTHVVTIQYWTRPAAPAAGQTAYRVNPWRKYAMQHRQAPSYTWLRAN